MTDEEHDSIENLKSVDMEHSDFKMHSYVKSPLKDQNNNQVMYS